MQTNESAIEAIEREALKRREEAAQKAQEPLPAFIKAIESTMVHYIVDPDLLPFALIDPERLVNLLNKSFQLTFRAPSFDPDRLASIGFDPTKITREAVLRFLLQGKDPMVAFQNGRYPTGPAAFTVIEELEFAKENIAVCVKGITDIAHVVVAEAFGMFWQAAGASKRWDTPSVQEQVQLVTYKTVTTVKFPVSPSALLNDSVVRYFEENTNKGKRLAAAMMPCSRYDGFKPADRAIGSWTFDQLILQFHAFDPLNGLSSTARVDIDTTSKDERGRGYAQVTSELPFDDHVELCRAFHDILTSNQKTKG